MGWSCSKNAHDTLQKIYDYCRTQTDSSNTWYDKGEKYFFETSRKEHNDGAITGDVMKFLPNGYCRKVGRLRINADGTVKTFAHYPLRGK